jgi:hypothetical protein
MSEEEGSPVVVEAQAVVAEAVPVSELAVSSPVATRSDSSSSTDSDVRRGRRRRRNYQQRVLRVLRAHSQTPTTTRNRLVDHESSAGSGSSGSDSPASDSDSSQVNFKAYYGICVLVN